MQMRIAWLYLTSAVVKKWFLWGCSWTVTLLAACLQCMKLTLIFLLSINHGSDSKTTEVLIQDTKTRKQQLKLSGWTCFSSIEADAVEISVGQTKPFHGPSSPGEKISLARQNEKQDEYIHEIPNPEVCHLQLTVIL